MTFGRPHGWVGYALPISGFAVVNLVPIRGPLNSRGALETMNDAGRAPQTRAYHVALSVLCAAAMPGIWAALLVSGMQG